MGRWLFALGLAFSLMGIGGILWVVGSAQPMAVWGMLGVSLVVIGGLLATTVVGVIGAATRAERPGGPVDLRAGLVLVTVGFPAFLVLASSVLGLVGLWFLPPGVITPLFAVAWLVVGPMALGWFIVGLEVPAQRRRHHPLIWAAWVSIALAGLAFAATQMELLEPDPAGAAIGLLVGSIPGAAYAVTTLRLWSRRPPAVTSEARAPGQPSRDEPLPTGDGPLDAFLHLPAWAFKGLRVAVAGMLVLALLALPAALYVFYAGMA